MKNAKHTPGPWTFNRNTVATHANNCIQAKEGERAVNIFYLKDSYWARPHNDVPDRSEANAARIVACVNALEGVENVACVPELLKELKLYLSNRDSCPLALDSAYDALGVK